MNPQRISTATFCALSASALCFALTACNSAPNAGTTGKDVAAKAAAPTKGQTGAATTGSAAATGSNVVIIKTNKGEITVELDAEKAPGTVKNFLNYVDEGFYDGTIFHRVIAGFMVQGGGFDASYKQKPAKAPIKNEATNGLRNSTGTVAMARTSVVDSATAQFFINVVDNTFLNHKSTTPREYGYAVFGKVSDGMDVVKAIETTPTKNRGGAFTDAPAEQVVIESIRRK